jgi:hypothetical protein
MVGKHMIAALRHRAALAILLSAVISTAAYPQEPAMSETGIPTDAAFHFYRSLRDIKAADSAVPRVDPDTVVDYGGLGLVDRFYIGETDSKGRLRRLETWDRQGIEDIAPDMVIAGKPLAGYAAPVALRDLADQTPLFFMQEGTEWRQVTAAETEGETRFIRLRWLKALRGDTVEMDAELIQQSRSLVEVFTYDGNGRLVEILRQRRETGFEVEHILSPAP